MRAVWTVRLMILAACAVAVLEREHIITPPIHGWWATGLLVLLLTIHFLVVARIARRHRR